MSPRGMLIKSACPFPHLSRKKSPMKRRLALLAVMLCASQPSRAVEDSPVLPPTPVSKAGTGQTRTLADVARERKLGIKGVQGGTLSVAGAPGMPSLPPRSDGKRATEADARLARAIRDGEWVDKNIHHNEDIRQNARREWDAAAENCRATPDCTPIYRENVAPDKLMTGNEAARALQKKSGPGADTPGR